ncbi:MAG: preprotein translocase subunit YajC [Acidiferrobacterales bacterium]
MSFFIADAMAAAPDQSSGNPMSSLFMLVILFVFMYFFLIRPQTKRAKQHRELVAALAKGDEVVTNGGVLARITNLSDQFVTVEIASGVEIKVQRSAIASVLPKGTIKSA